MLPVPIQLVSVWYVAFFVDWFLNYLERYHPTP